MKFIKLTSTLGVLLALTLPTACGGSKTTPPLAPPAPPEAKLGLSGVIMDGPVSGGRLFVFDATDLAAARANVAGSTNRAEALASSSPLATVDRDVSGGANYTVELPQSSAGATVFLVFDSEGSLDNTFNDVPFNLESVAVLGAAGTNKQVNITPQTTLVSRQIERSFDNQSAGSDIQADINLASASVKAALSKDEFGRVLTTSSFDFFGSTDVDQLDRASSYVGILVRTVSTMSGLARDVVMDSLAADVADGVMDGVAPTMYLLSGDETEAVAKVGRAAVLSGPRDETLLTSGCSNAMTELSLACDYEVLDEFFLNLTACADTTDKDEQSQCQETAQAEREEASIVCDTSEEARLELCEDIDDLPYDPEFGPEFADQFVDPLQIGVNVEANTYLPLVQGNFWTLEGRFIEDGEEITETIEITVTDRTKLIDGITCLVVRDVVSIDGELVEDTDDWFAQDVDGNVWYCGEEAKDYEVFEGDEPALPELVAIDGSFKSGRDGDKAGLLLPNAPDTGAIFRQEVSLGNAEDVIEVISVTGSITGAAASCTETCLVTYDYSTLDPESQENKYYAPGIGLIVEVDLESGDRVELIEYGNTNELP